MGVREIQVLDGHSVTTKYTSPAFSVRDVNRVAGAVEKVSGGGSLDSVDLIWLDEGEDVDVTEAGVGSQFDEPVKARKVKLQINTTGTVVVDAILIGADYL